MRNSKIKLTITAMFLAGTIGTFSVFAHEGEGKDMISSEGMQGMGGMMGMMSGMSAEDRKTMTEACMKMMQSHGGDSKGGAEKDGDAEAS